MATAFQRVCVVIVDSLRVQGLRTQFRITKTLVKEPNTASIKITSLSAATRAQMQKKGAKIILSAGYPDTIGQIFSGVARTIDHIREGTEYVTHIQCGDGEQQFQVAHASKSYGAGAQISQIIKDTLTQLGISPGNIDAALASGAPRGNLTQFLHGYAVHGRASAELDKLMKSIGMDWSIQDGALQATYANGVIPGSSIPLLNEDTGLVGSPDHGTPQLNGLPAITKIKNLIVPAIKCGGRVQVQSKGTNGIFVVQKLAITGDTAGQDWYDESECYPG